MMASRVSQRCLVLLMVISFLLQQIDAYSDSAICKWTLVTSAVLFSGINVCIKTAINSMACLSHECCIDRAQRTDLMKNMIKSLHSKVVGQELAIQTIDEIIRRYQRGQNSIRNNKIFLFHGDIGTGKTHTASLMGHHLFPQGNVSQLILHVDLVSMLDDNDNDYHRANQWLTDQVLALSRLCNVGVVIMKRWDEISLSKLNIIDLISNHTIDDPNRMKIRRITFILISTLGSEEINNATITARSNHLTRGNFPDRQLYHTLAELICKQIPQFTVIDNLMDIIIPFLPLQKDHVKQCALMAMSTVDINQEKKVKVAEMVANSGLYYGRDEFLFAKLGCSRVYDIVNNVL